MLRPSTTETPLPEPRPLRRRARRLALGLGLLALAGCLPFGGRGAGMGGPPSLRVDFDSARAAARLTWQRPPLQDFVRYEVERIDAGQYTVLARLDDGADTSWVDEGLLGDRPYRYRVSTVFATGDGGDEQRLPSTVVEGGIHRHVSSWSVPEGFLPTRILIDGDGVLHVFGAGAGHIERYDRAGHPLGPLVFTDGVNVSLETATLDGPSAAFDGDGNLHVVHNTQATGQPPEPWWTRIGADGRIHWTKPLRTVFARHVAVDGDRVYIESISHLQAFDSGGELLEHYPLPPLMVSSVGFWGGGFAALVEPLGYDTSGWQAPRLVVYGTVARVAVRQVLGRDPLSSTDGGAGLLDRPSDFAAGPAGDRVFVVNAGSHRIEVFRDGRYLTRWGDPGVGAGHFRFRGPAAVLPDVTGSRPVTRPVVAGGIACDREGFVYVADTFNGRIQKFAP